jgi:hypothetical protein
MAERWLIQISEYALVSIPDTWDGSRNPVRYRSMEELGIDPNQLDFQTMPVAKSAQPKEVANISGGLTIAEAKHGLAERFGVSVNDIEITIRG